MRVASKSFRKEQQHTDLWSLGVLPVLSAGVFLGLLGVYWDIAWHIDLGRHTFFSPPHNLIYAGMLAVLATSLWGLWRDRRDTALHLPLGRLRLHPGLLIVAVGAALVLLFAPLDELWHRWFGEELTLWAPMHLIGLLSLTLATFGGLVTAWVEQLVADSRAKKGPFMTLTLAFAALLLGWMMLWLAEYEFNVPQFPTLWHPILLAGLPSFVLVFIARLHPSAWAATWTALLFTTFRLAFAGWLTLTVSFEWAGDSRPLIPMLILSGLTVDLFARRGAAGWLQGVAAGAVTLAVNAIWIHFSDVVWYEDVVLAAALPGLALAAFCGWLGGQAAEQLSERRTGQDQGR